jgi:diguanylate cyclase (GGDEF)-like protein
MGDGLRTIRVVSADESLLASVSASAEALDGWGVEHVPSQEALAITPPDAGDVILLDSWLAGTNVYEFCRMLTGRTKCRTFIVVEARNEYAEAIARFSGATGTLKRPVAASALRSALGGIGEPAAALRSEARDTAPSFELPETLLADLRSGEVDPTLVRAVVDAETGLFNYAFLGFKLDEEFKRARRFDHPLACVMLGFEGQAGEEILRDLASIFLESSRDTDILGRFDENSFLFLLPCTGPDGANVMAQRVGEMAQERELSDLVGDPLVISVGIAIYPNPEIRKREDLFGTARQAFVEARNAGGGVVCSS